MTTKNTADTKAPVEALNIQELALSIHGGDPVAVKLDTHLVNVRRDFTGDEVATYVGFFAQKSAGSAEDQISKQLDLLLDEATTTRVKKELCEWLLDQPFVIASSYMVQLGKVAGLRDEDGTFLTGALSSRTR